MNTFKKIAMSAAFLGSTALTSLAQNVKPIEEGTVRQSANVGFNFVKQKGNYKGGTPVNTYQLSVGTDYNGFPKAQSASLGRTWKTVNVARTAEERAAEDSLNKKEEKVLGAADPGRKGMAGVDSMRKALGQQIGTRQNAVLENRRFNPGASREFSVAALGGQHPLPEGQNAIQDSISHANGGSGAKSFFGGLKVNADVWKPISATRSYAFGVNLGADGFVGYSSEAGARAGGNVHGGVYADFPLGNKANMKVAATGGYEITGGDESKSNQNKGGLAARVKVALGF